LKSPQVIDEGVLQGIEHVVKEARAGKITEIVCVANDKSEKAFVRISGFSDAWRILGALEYAKQTVHKGMN